MRFLVAALLLSATPGVGLAQATPPSCVAAPLPVGLQGWDKRTDLAAVAAPAEARKATLPIGKGVNGQLKKTADVAFPAAPGKLGAPASYGGLYEFRIDQAGDYQVSFGAGAWIEVVAGKTLVASTSHGHGVECSTLRKAVVFSLKPGRYLLEISAGPDPVLPLMVSRAPG